MSTHASRDVDMTTCVQINKMVANSKEQNSRSHCGHVWIRLQTLVARIDEKSAKHPTMRMIFSTARVSSTARLNWGSDFPYHGSSAVILVPRTMP